MEELKIYRPVAGSGKESFESSGIFPNGNSGIYRHVLLVGPDCRNHRGGIGAVINEFGKYFRPFHFISTYKTMHPLLSPFYSGIQLMRLVFYLLFHPSIRILHVHGASRGSFFRKYFVFLVSKYIFSKRVVYHIHGGEFHIFTREAGRLTRKMIRHFIGKADVVICLSETWREFFEETFHPGRLEVIRNFVSIPHQVPDREQSGDKVIFLFLGKVERNKGIYDLIEVISRLKKENVNNFELWIGGNGETDRLNELLDKKQLRDTVRFLGWISGTRKAEVLAGSDVYILPSYNEGLPVSILEAMSYGLPVISTRTGGIPEMVDHTRSGLLVNPGDQAGIAEAMRILCGDPLLRKTMGNKGREIVEKDFSAENSVNRVRGIYIDLLNEVKTKKK